METALPPAASSHEDDMKYMKMHLRELCDRLGEVCTRDDKLEAQVAKLDKRLGEVCNNLFSDGLSDDRLECDADDEPSNLSEESARWGSFALSCYVGLMVVAIALAFVIATMLTPGFSLYQYMYSNAGRRTNCVYNFPKENKPWRVLMEANKAEVPKSVWSKSRQVYVNGMTVGLYRGQCLTACVIQLVSTFCMFLAAAVPAIVVTLRPQTVSSDFIKKGTLSNLCKEITTARGRVFSTMLFTGSLLSMVAQYPLYIYDRWYISSHKDKSEYALDLYADRTEKIIRASWAIVPNVGLMLTAAMPTSNRGTIMSVIHNIAAPVSMFYAGVMETIQLAYADNAFSYFFCGEEYANWFGKLGACPRMRVIILSYAWIAGALFISLQIYLNLGLIGVKVKPSYSLALWSFFCEITAFLLEFTLPALQSAYLLVQLYRDSIIPAAAVMETFMPPGSGSHSSWAESQSNSSSMLESAQVPLRFLHKAARASFPKQLRAGADGQPLF